MLGTWHALSPEGADIIFSSSTFRWGKEEGRWLMQESQIWLLDPKQNTGTKWDVKVERMEDKVTLILVAPEDFHYRGKGQYIYFQMTPPQLTHRFQRGLNP